MKKIVILASGSGTNFQRIAECVESGEITNAKICLLVTDRECFALQRATKLGIPAVCLKRGKTFSQDLNSLISSDTDLIVCAGFLSILNQEFCKKWRNKIINIHPALLPKYGGKGMWGMKVHEAVKAAGETESGATVHYVTAEIDQGSIILQQKFKINSTDSPEDIAEKVHEIEYRIFPKAVEKVLNPKELNRVQNNF